MLTSQEFKHLQTLCCLDLPPQDEVKIGGHVSTIVEFLGKINDIRIDSDILDGTASDTFDHTLSPIAGVYDCPDVNSLFANAHHEKINNSIVIKSVVEE